MWLASRAFLMRSMSSLRTLKIPVFNLCPNPNGEIQRTLSKIRDPNKSGHVFYQFFPLHQ